MFWHVQPRSLKTRVIIEKLDNCSPGWDGIQHDIIKQTFSSKIKTLCHITNLSFDKRFMADELKIANVVPDLYKIGDAILINNYNQFPYHLYFLLQKLNNLYYGSSFAASSGLNATLYKSIPCVHVKKDLNKVTEATKTFIVTRHNELRANVNPLASDMQIMVRRRSLLIHSKLGRMFAE